MDRYFLFKTVNNEEYQFDISDENKSKFNIYTFLRTIPLDSNVVYQIVIEEKGSTIQDFLINLFMERKTTKMEDIEYIEVVDEENGFFRHILGIELEGFNCTCNSNPTAYLTGRFSSNLHLIFNIADPTKVQELQDLEQQNQ